MDLRECLPMATFEARALLVAARIDARTWPEGETLARVPLAVRVPGGGVAVLFRYGVVVLFGVPADAEKALLERLKPLVTHHYRRPEAEEIRVRVEAASAEGLHENALVIGQASVERLQLIADVLSKSVLLGHYETRMSADFDRIEPLALELERRGRIRGGTRDHMKRIGGLLLVEHRTVGRAEIGEKPELLREHPELERLYALLEAEFEVVERLGALERKLDVAGRTVRTLVDLIGARHSLRVEWYIVALIVVEILLTLYAMWFR